MIRYCTVLDSSDLMPGLALVESIFEHERDETQITIVCLDEASLAILSQIAMPQIRPIALADLTPDSTMSECRLGPASCVMRYLHARQSAPAPIAYFDPTAYLVAPLTELVAELSGVAWIPTRADPTGRPCMLISAGDNESLALLEGCLQAAPLEQPSAARCMLPMADFGSSELPRWCLDGSLVLRITQELMALCSDETRALDERVVGCHAATYVEALSRAAAWVLSCDAPAKVVHGGADMLLHQTFIAARGLRDELRKRLSEHALVEVCPEWDIFASQQLPREATAHRPAVAIRCPPVSRLTVNYSDTLSPAHRLRVSVLV